MTCMSDISVSRRTGVSKLYKNSCDEIHVHYVAVSSVSGPSRTIDLALPSEIQTLGSALGDTFIETLNTLYTCFAQYDATAMDRAFAAPIFCQDSEIVISHDLW